MGDIWLSHPALAWSVLAHFPSRMLQLGLAGRVPLEDPQSISIGGISGLHTSSNGELSTCLALWAQRGPLSPWGHQEANGPRKLSQESSMHHRCPGHGRTEKQLRAQSRGQEVELSRADFQVVKEKISTISPPRRPHLSRRVLDSRCEGGVRSKRSSEHVPLSVSGSPSH